MAETTNSGHAAVKASPKMPDVMPVTPHDILEILAAGLRDFRAAPMHGLGVGAIYTGGGWILILLLMQFDLPYLVYPLAAGFAFIAPFIATAFYAISRTLEKGDRPTWARVISSTWDAAGRDLRWMALVTGFSLFIWMDIAAILFFGFMGINSLDIQDLLREIFTTPMGLLFLVIGNSVGALIALAVFSFSAVSFPMLFDRDIDFVTAMVTSVKLVLANKFAMVIWCATIAALIGVSLLSGLFGLLVTLPVLGHASWHLYRRAVEPVRKDD